MTIISFALIRVRTVIFGSVLIVCIGLLIFSFSYLESRRNVNSKLEREIRSNQDAITGMLNDIALINKYQGRFRVLSNSGFLDNENRLSWIEQLESTAIRLQLPNLQYQIDPQKNVSGGQLMIPSNITLYQSTLRFESSLLHEGDLATLISELTSLSSGLPVLEGCKLSRINGSIDASLSPNFNSSCEISWYTANYQDGSLGQLGNGP